MNKVSNPFAPGAGAPPPELVGRDDILEDARVLFARVLLHRSEKSIFLNGLRGVGKTVLLNEMERIARQAGYRTVLVEAHENKPLPVLLIPPLRLLLYDLDRMAGAGNMARRGLAVLKSFLGPIKISLGDFEAGLDIEPEMGAADSGDLEADLPNLFCAVAEAAQERQTGIIILIDEVQYLAKEELSALVMAMHKMQQRQLPLVLLGAGLPILPALIGDSKSYAERLLQFPAVGPLTEHDANRALQDPVRAAGVEFTGEALREIFRLTQGYPYFLQEWGYQSWNHALVSPITLETVQNATATIIKRLDDNFFRVRFERLAPKEKEFLRAMAELGPGPYRSADVATVLGVKLGGLGPVRAVLIRKGMIYSPEHGELAFTVPLFDDFMRRVMKFRTWGKVALAES
jgi:hypothetical protein